jgi:hypothetical protein
MKKLIVFALMILVSGSIAQTIHIDTTNFIRAGVIQPVLDSSVTNKLDAFNSPDDAIIYIMRMKSMVGAAGKWQVKVDTNMASLGLSQYVAVHIDSKASYHYVYLPNMDFHFVGFKPNTYYMIRMKGFSLIYDYLDLVAFNEIIRLRRANLTVKK